MSKDTINRLKLIKGFLTKVELYFFVMFFLLFVVWILLGWTWFWKSYLTCMVIYITVRFFNIACSKAIEQVTHEIKPEKQDNKKSKFQQRLEEMQKQRNK